MKIQENAPLLSHNTFGMDVKARVLITYDTVSELRQALRLCHERYAQLPLLHIGGGSNLLFLADYEGIVLFSAIKGVQVLHETPDEVLVQVGAGVSHDDFVALSVQRGWYGMENLSLIPGQVGASAVQNIGAYGAEVSDVMDTVQGVSLQTGEPCGWHRDECCYAYRWSIFKGELKGRYAITSVSYRLSKHFTPRLEYGGLRKVLVERGIPEDRLTAATLREIIIDIRRRKLPDPTVQGNAGSFFMNPVVEKSVYQRIAARYPEAPHYPVDEDHVKVPAGWLIEKSGWKGRSLGPAAVHDRQALVLVNKGGACGADIVRLCDAVRADVRRMFGIDLHPEVNFI